MRIKQVIIILLLTIFIYSLYPLQTNTLTDSFKKIIEIDKANEKLIKLNVDKLHYKEYFHNYIVVSEDLDNYKEYKEWFENMENIIHKDILGYFKRADVLYWKEKKKKEFAEKLLFFLHERIFKKYDFNANKISEMINVGYYNCVSSSIIYSIFLKKYGLQNVAIETDDHVFIKVIFETEEIDVESTNKYGFDPGKKNGIINEFGKLTGFTYVPPKDYNKRRDINLKKLLMIVYHNLANHYYLQGDFLRSANLGYLILKGRGDKKGKEDFDTYFNNYIVGISNNGQYRNAIEDINSYLDHIEWNETFAKMRIDLIINYVNDWEDYYNSKEFQYFLIEQNEKYPKIKDTKRYVEAYFYFIYKSISFNNKNKNYIDSYKRLKGFSSQYQHKEIDKLFANIMISEMQDLENNNDYDLISKRILEIKLDFPEYIDIIKDHEKIYSVNKINHILQANEYQKALDESKILIMVYPEDKNVILVTKNSYIKYTISLYENHDLDNLIKFTEEGLELFPNDKTLNNNYLAFFKNFVNKAIEENDMIKARKIVDLAKEKFPADKQLIKLDQYLVSKKY